MTPLVYLMTMPSYASHCMLPPVERLLQEANPMAGVFQNIDPPPPSLPLGVRTRRALRGVGVNILEYASHRIGLLQ